MMGARRYAADTSVPVTRSRGEIEKLLRAWKCTGFAWADDIEEGEFALQFKWRHDGRQLSARFSVPLPLDPEDREYEQDRRRLHRLLLILIKGLLNSIAGGLITDTQAFLPFLIGSDGETLSDALGDRLHFLADGYSAKRLLGEPKL